MRLERRASSSAIGILLFAFGDLDAAIAGTLLMATAGSASSGSADALALQLRWHGIKPESFGVSAAGRTAADAVLDMARASGADMLVMGGYDHARLREFIFGGFTRQVLRECRLPVFLFH